MKKLLLGLLLMASSAWGVTGQITMGSLTTNPASNSVLVVTPAFASGGSQGGHYVLNILCSSSAAAATQYEFQILNGSAAVVSAYNMYLSAPAGGMAQVGFTPSFQVPDGYKFQVINPSAITGSVQCTIATGTESGN